MADFQLPVGVNCAMEEIPLSSHDSLEELKYDRKQCSNDA